MKIRTVIIYLVISWVGCSNAAPLPLMDFAKEAQYKNVKLSPDGKHFAAAVPHGDQTMLVTVKRDTMQLVHVYRFSKNEHVAQYYWANNERLVFTRYIKRGYRETPTSYGQIYAGNIDGSKKSIIFGIYGGKNKRGTRMYGSRGAESAWGNILHMLPNDPENIIIESRKWGQDADSAVSIFKLNIYSSKKKLITRTPFGLMDVILDSQGIPVIASGRDHGGNERKYFYKNKKWVEIEKNNEIINFDPVSVNNEGTKLYLTSHINGKTEALYEYNMSTKKIEMKFHHQTSDILSYIRAPESNASIVGVKVMPGNIENFYINKNSVIAKAHQKMAKAFSGNDVTITSWTDDHKEMVVLVTSDKNPGDFYLFNRENNSVNYLLSRKKWIDPAKMAIRKPIEFQARDGKTIYGYLTLPPNSNIESPLVTYVHGGPYGPRDYWWYDSTPQMLANNGYAVLQVNYRGSGGYGLDYEEVAYQKRSTLIQQDIIDGTKWALSQHAVEDEKACIMGWSFGGYSALMSPLIEPDLFKCSIAAAGVYDAVEQEEDADYSRVDSVSAQAAKVYGSDEKLLKKESPLTYIDKLKIPIFIVHGGKDRRVPPEQAYLLKDALEERNMPYEWMFKNSEGHGFSNETNREEFYQRSLTFLSKHLK